MKLALLTCTNLPDWEQDDRFFHQVLEGADIDWTAVAWDSDTDWSTFDVTLIRTTWDYVDRRDAFSKRLKEIASQTIYSIQWRLLNGILKRPI